MIRIVRSISFAAAVMLSTVGPLAAPCAAQPATLASESAAAAQVVRAYYAALAARDYGTAYAQWGDNGAASGKSLADFARGFAQTRSTEAQIVQVGEVEGAAGSMFVTVGVDVRAVLTNGRRQHFVGSYTLRRVNDVPGATAAQRRWHIQSASLQAAQP